MVNIKNNFKITFGLTFGILLSLFIFFIFNSTYALPNVYLGKTEVPYKRRVETAALLAEKIGAFEGTNLRFDVESGIVEAKMADLGIILDEEETSNRVARLGRSGNLAKDLLTQIKAPFFKTTVNPVYSVDFVKLSQFLNGAFSGYEQRATDASIVYKNGRFELLDEAEGTVIDRAKLIKAISENINNLSQDPIRVFKRPDLPMIKRDQAKRAFEKVQTLNNQSLILSHGHDRWVLGGQNLQDLLTFYPDRDEGSYLASLTIFGKTILIHSIQYGGSAQSQLDVKLDKEKLNVFIERIAKTLNRPTVNADLRFENGKVAAFTPAQDGQKLDKAKTVSLVLEKISIESLDNQKQININLPVSVTQAKIVNEQINSLGIRELIGRGVSYFAGSIANRVHNIALGSSRVSGVLIKPGEIFSFNMTVGEVSAATGYRQAYVISQGRTILDDGGGVCQVSTTIFRAALNAGLPIVSRTAHAYRVAYYEQNGFKPGLDATVWSPSVDLQFKNDSDQHILIQTTVNRANSKLQVDIYGTADGRKVEVGNPTITNVRDAPDPKYQEDPGLPKGVTKQVDFAARGATVTFNRKVFKGDRAVIDEVFKSGYRPWQAVYLVGTGG